jgi:hypothetical protein
LKYFETVGREMPLAAENSSIVLILGDCFLPRCLPTFAATQPLRIGLRSVRASPASAVRYLP